MTGATYTHAIPYVYSERRMPQIDTQPQATRDEPRDLNVTVRVTATEKRAVQFVAAKEGLSESDLIHRRVMGDLAREAERLRAALAEIEPAA